MYVYVCVRVCVCVYMYVYDQVIHLNKNTHHRNTFYQV